MQNKKTAWIIVGVILIILGFVFTISWFYFPDWQGIPGGFLTLLGAVLITGFPVLNNIFGILEKIGLLRMGKKDEKNELTQNIAGGVHLDGKVNVVTTSITGGEFIGTKYVFEAPIASPVLPSLFHQLPSPPADFTGREKEIEQLVKALSENKGAAITGLVGMGGVGKTALGLVIAHQIKDNYPDAQLFVNLGGTLLEPLSSYEVMKQIIRVFNKNVNFHNFSDQDIEKAYLSLLSGKRALLFLDNAHDLQQVKLLLPPPTCAVLVTSRRYFVLPSLTPIRLDVLSKEEAENFLLKLFPRVRENAPEIARLCAYLPMALRIAGSFLATNLDWTPEAYIDELSKRYKRMAMLRSTDDPELNIEATISLSYDQLTPSEQVYLCKMSIFPASFRKDAAMHILELGQEQTSTLLSKLLQISMLQFNSETERYALHDLLVDFSQSRLVPQDREKASLQYAQHYLRILMTSDNLYIQGAEHIQQGLSLFDEEWVHIQASQSWAENHIQDGKHILQLCSNYPFSGIHVLNLRLDKRIYIQWLDAALQASRNLGDLRGEGNALGNLGNAYKDLGDTHKAIEHYEISLAILQKIGDRHGEGAAFSNLGSAYERLGENKKAISFHEKALLICQEIGDLRGESVVYGNLGIVYRNFGEIQKAIDYHQKTLAIFQKIGDRPMEGSTLGSLGVDFEALGEKRKAIGYFEQKLQIAKEYGDRFGEGSALGSLGVIYKDLGEINKAIEYHEQYLKIALEIGDHIGEGTALVNLGIAYKNLGETHKAIEYYEQYLLIVHETGDRSGEGAAMVNLGNAYADLSENIKAIEYYEKALLISQEIGYRYGEGNSLGNLGVAYADLGEIQKARDYLNQALLIFKDIQSHNIDWVRKWLKVLEGK